MPSQLFKLDWNDILHSLVNAVFAAVLVTLYKLTIGDGFDIYHADWVNIGHSVINAIVAVVTSTLAKRLLTNSNGEVLGMVKIK